MRKEYFLGPLLILILWWLISLMGIVSPLLLPSPIAVFSTFIDLTFVTGELWLDCLTTIYRMFFGLLISAMVGIPLGILVGSVPTLARSIEFLIDFFRSIPAIALFPLFLLIFGIGDPSKIAVVIYGCTLIIIINSAYGVSHAPKIRRLVGKSFGLKQHQILIKIVFPDALPQIIVGLRTALSLALVLVVVSEMFFGTSHGLGYRIYNYHLVFSVPEMYSVILWTGILGYMFNKLFIIFERRFIHWAGQ